MTVTEQVLLIILSAVLAVFLILGIWLIINMIRISRHIKSITEKAERIADKAENITSFFERTAAPAAITKLLSNIAETVFKKGKSKSK